MQYDYVMNKLENVDIIEFGLIPEFVGRVPVTAVLEELDEDALVSALTKPHKAIIKQYQSLFNAFNVSPFTCLEKRLSGFHNMVSFFR